MRTGRTKTSSLGASRQSIIEWLFRRYVVISKPRELLLTSNSLRPLSRIPVCSVRHKPVTKQSDLQFFVEKAGSDSLALCKPSYESKRPTRSVAADHGFESDEVRIHAVTRPAEHVRNHPAIV